MRNFRSTLFSFLPATRRQFVELRFLIINLKEIITMNQAELAQRLDDANTRAQKVAREQAAALQALRDELANGGVVSPEVEAKLSALEATIQTEDDLNPDTRVDGAEQPAA